VFTINDVTGGVAPWAVVLLRDVKTGAPLAMFLGDESGVVRVSAAAGPYDVSIASPKGSLLRSAVVINGASLRFSLDTDCLLSAGVASGEVKEGDVVWARRQLDGAYFGAIVRDGGVFELCLSEGTYRLEPDGDLVSMATVFAPPARLALRAYGRGTVEAAAPDDGTALAAAGGLAEIVPPNALLIGVGEPNHGARECLQLRLTQSLDLARRLGVRYVALEAGAAEVFPLDDYVNGLDVDVVTAVSRLGYWMWDTHEMLAVLDELREFNLKAPATGRVHLVGVDVQYSRRAAQYLLSELASTLSSIDRDALEVLAFVDDPAAADVPQLLNVIEALSLRTRSSTLRTALALEQVRQRLRMGLRGPSLEYMTREQGMATMALVLARYLGGAKAVVWAHNSHVDFDAMSGVPSMGTFLRGSLGRRYVSVGVFVGAGRVRAWDADGTVGVIVHELPVPPIGSLERLLLARLPKEVSFLNLQGLPAPLLEWLTVPRHALEFGGAVHSAGAWPLRDFRASFDAIAFVRAVSPTHPTASGERRAAP
jgi:erythromycin esterase